MANAEGTPIWYELITTDADGAQKFYADVVGWSIAPMGMEGTGDYRILTAPDGQGVGGLMTSPDGAPMKPGWFCYIGVADVDGLDVGHGHGLHRVEAALGVFPRRLFEVGPAD